MKNRFTKYPYEKEFISDIASKKDLDGASYATPKENIIFFGDEHIIGDVYKINSEDPEIRNISSQNYFKIKSDNIQMNIDYERRLDIMQQNLGSAILRLCIEKSTNLNILNYKIDENSNKIYLDAKDIPFSTIDKLEELSNYIINANLLIRVFEEEYKISVKGMGSIYYTGPCLKRTGEVSILKISDVTKEDEKIILHISCGQRGYFDYTHKSNLINNIKTLLFLDNDEDILKEIKKLKSSGDNLKLENKKMEMELGLEAVKEYKNIATNVEGINYIYKVVQNVNFKDLKFISSKIMNEANYVQIYGIPNGPTSQILVARSKNLNIDLKSIYNKISLKYPMNGTGNMFMIQANINSNQLAGAMETFLVEVKNANLNKK